MKLIVISFVFCELSDKEVRLKCMIFIKELLN